MNHAEIDMRKRIMTEALKLYICSNDRAELQAIVKEKEYQAEKLCIQVQFNSSATTKGTCTRTYGSLQIYVCVLNQFSQQRAHALGSALVWREAPGFTLTIHSDALPHIQLALAGVNVNGLPMGDGQSHAYNTVDGLPDTIVKQDPVPKYRMVGPARVSTHLRVV